MFGDQPEITIRLEGNPYELCQGVRLVQVVGIVDRCQWLPMQHLWPQLRLLVCSLKLYPANGQENGMSKFTEKANVKM